MSASVVQPLGNVNGVLSAFFEQFFLHLLDELLRYFKTCALWPVNNEAAGNSQEIRQEPGFQA